MLALPSVRVSSSIVSKTDSADSHSADFASLFAHLCVILSEGRSPEAKVFASLLLSLPSVRVSLCVGRKVLRQLALCGLRCTKTTLSCFSSLSRPFVCRLLSSVKLTLPTRTLRTSLHKNNTQLFLLAHQGKKSEPRSLRIASV